MTSTFRIPRKELTGLYGRAIAWYARRTFGQVPDSAYVLAHHPRAMRAMFGLEMKVGRWKALDPTLKTLAEMATAAAVGCSWCLDFGYFLSREDGLDPTKVSQVPRWRDTDGVYTELERDVMAYAEAMTATPPTVTDDMVASLVARSHPRNRIDDYRGLYAQRPLAALALGFFLLCLAGLPPGIIGLFAKVTVFAAAVDAGLGWLAVVMAVNVVIALVYYLRWTAVLFRAREDAPAAPQQPAVRLPLPLTGAVALTAVVGIALSGAPQLVLRFSEGVLF